MNNDELKKKMVEIIINAIWKDAQADYDSTDESEARTIADALIAAGIGDVKETKFESDHYWRMWQGALVELERAEHRAEVSQLIAEKACELVFSEEINDEDWVNVIFNYKKEKGIQEIGITTNILYDYLKDQAEKELAEERKDEQS